MRFLYFGAAVAAPDTFDEKLFIQPITDPLREDSVFAQFDFNIKTERKSSDDSLHFDIFPKSIGKILTKLDVNSFTAIITQGRWKDQWGVTPSVIYPPGAILYGDGTQWRQLCSSIGGLMSASFEAMALEHQSYRWIHPAKTPWLPHQFSSMPYEAMCSENLSSLLKLLPCKGVSGLASLLHPIDVAESAYKSVQISAERGKDGFTFRGTLQVVLPSEKLLLGVSSCASAKKSTVWFRLPSHVDVGTQAFKSDGWVLHSQPSEEWPGDLKLPKMKTSPVPLAMELATKQKINIQRDILAVEGKSERTHGKYSLNVHTKQKTGFRFTDQLPYFIQPLWNTLDVTIEGRRLRGVEAVKALNLQLDLSKEWKTPSFFHFDVPVDKPVSLKVDVLKAHINNKEFFAGCEKGFDLAASAWLDDIGVSWPVTMDSTPCKACALKDLPLSHNPSELHFTEGMLVMVPMPDFSMPFNVIAVSTTVITFFYSMLAKNSMQGFAGLI